MSGDTREKDGQNLTLEVYYRSDNPDFVAMATFLQSINFFGDGLRDALDPRMTV